MKVNVQYAETHLADLISAADKGEEVEIERAGKPALKLVVSSTPAFWGSQASRVLGAGRGELRIPSTEEWKAMDTEIEREMLDAPLTTSGDIRH